MRWAGVALAALVACETAASQPAPTATDVRALPHPDRSGGPSLAAVLADRHSTRAFGTRALDDRELAQLLWAAQGVTTTGHRTAPSAGALYPLTVRVVDARCVCRYVPAEHALVRETARDRRAELAAASHGQASIAGAPEILVISADVSITARKYGARAERYATLEAGHAAQNILLEATALGLAAVPVGSFDDDAVRRALALPAGELPLYLVPVGSTP
jgi:SagB-type dehydrogenase family enzyme